MFHHLIESADLYSSFKKLLSYEWWRAVKYLIVDTRRYEDGLMFVDRLFDILELYRKRFTKKEFENYNMHLTYFKLVLLDKSDRWFRFVEMYEQINQDDYSILQGRYEIIQRKINRQLEGKSVEHLKHKPPLSDIETQKRIDFILDKLEKGRVPGWWRV